MNQTSTAAWLQFDISLDERADPTTRLDTLFDALAGWSRSTPVPAPFWFVRKAPGLRLRARSADEHASHAKPLADVLRAAQRAGTLLDFQAVTYEPELFRLGGAELIEQVHDVQCEGTAVWLRWSVLRRTGRTRLSSQLMALACFDLLLEQCLPAEEERWDVWCALLHYYTGEWPAAPLPPKVQIDARVLRSAAEPCEAELLDEALHGAQRFARALHDVRRRGVLVGGERTALAAMAAFHWNRWALPLPSIRELLVSRTRELHPGRFFVTGSRAEP